MDNQPDQQPPEPHSPQPTEPQPLVPNPTQLDQQPAAPQSTEFTQPLPVQPASQPAPQLFAPSSPQPQPLGAPPEPKKRSLLWLWITLGIVGLLISAAIITVVVSVSNANSAARTYNSSVKLYLEDVADTISGSAASPSDVVDDVTSIEQPELKEVFLSSLSNEHKESAEMSQEIAALVDATVADINTYADFYNFYDDFTQARQDLIEAEYVAVSVLQSASPSESRFGAEIDKMVDACSELSSLAQGLSAPEEAKRVIDDAKADTETVCGYVGDIKTAFGNRSSDGLLTALTNYATAGSEFETSYALVKTEYESIASNVKDLADPVQERADAIR